MSKVVGVLTGGGDCPGLNPAIRGAVMRGMDHGFKFVGLKGGWRGLVEGDTLPLSLKEVDEITNKGGTILTTSRTNPFKIDGAVEKCLANFKKLKLDALIAMGGEDTLGVATKLHAQHQVNVIGVPKTMDNDLSATDFTFGFDTSVTVAMEACDRLKDTGRSHNRIMVLEVMGRHAGWVALYTGIAAQADWILYPEVKPDIKKMCAHLKIAHARKGVGLVVVSEGVKMPSQENVKEELDQFGHMILKNRAVGDEVAAAIEAETKLEARSSTIGHIQRGGAPTLFDRILGLRVGVKAADLVAEGNWGKMVALKGNNVEAVPLADATKELKLVPKEWLDFAEVFWK